MAETSPAATPAAPAASFWWTHDSIENVAEPLDPTADDAAAHCLSLITAHTSDHLRRHAALLRPYLTTNTTTTTTGAHGAGDAAQLYHQLQWSSVLVPLLGQLRKAMARAWEERVAEQAEAAAATAHTLASKDTPTIDVASSPSHTPASSCAAQEAAVCADPVLLRRLRVVQQRIYLAFLKALLQGIIIGTRAVVHDVTSSTPEEEKAAAASEKAEAETAQVARGVAVLLDGLLANMIAAAASTTAAAAASRWAAGEASLKSRRGHPHSPHASPLSPPVAHVSNNNNGSSAVSAAVAADATGGVEWFIGMMPSYLRAAQYGSQHADTASAEAAAGSGAAPDTITAAATTSDAPSIPSLALCLVSYIGVFVGDAGLQLLPAEQAAQLPYFTQEVETILLRQLTTRSARVVSSTTDSTTSVEVVAQIEEATRFLRHITETQLYHDANGVAVVAAEDDDCTALFAVPSALSRSIASATAPSTPAAAMDYSVASLLSLSSYSACCRLVKELERWWSACRRSMEEIVTGNHLVEAEEKEKLAAEDALEGHDAASAAAAATTEAWMALRRQAMLLTAVLSSYADTSLLLPTYTALLVRLFYPAQDVPLNAWKTCLRDVQHVLRTNHLLPNSMNSSGSGNGLFSGAAATTTTATSSSSSLSRPLRAHYRHSGGDSFPAASYRRVLSLVSRSAGGALEAHVPNSSQAATRSTDTAPSVLPLGFSVLHAPLLVLDKIIAATLSSTTVASSLCFDTVVGEKLHQSEKAVAAASPASNTTASSAPPSARALAMSGTTLSAAEVLALSFPRLYRLLHALDQALQHCVRRAEELTAAGTASEVEEENGAWAVAASALPHHFALLLGAALDDSFTASLRHPTDEVNGSLLLMFYAAIFRMLGRADLPRLRASLSTFLGEDGDGLLPYLRHHIVDQQRRGLVAFFLPPLRALGLDFSACDDTDASLAVAAGPALAYAFELPRLFFFHSSETPVTEVAWSAQAAAQSYLCALLAPGTTAAADAMLDIVREAGAVARVRAGKSTSSSGSGSKSSAPVSLSRGQLSSQAVVNDAMTAFFYAMCRWCMAQLPPTSPATAARATSSVSSGSSFPLESVREVVHSALCPPGDAAAAQLPVLTSLAARLRGTSAVADAVAPARAATWIWECSYADVDPVHLQACARRLLRDFTASFSGHAPVRTLLAVRAVVEQRLKVEDAAAAAAAVAAALLAVVRDDVQELVARQEQTQLQVEKKVNEEEAPAEQTSTAAATAEERAETQPMQQDNTPQPDAPRAEDEGGEVSAKAALTPATPAVAATTATAASTRPPSIVAGAELRRYLDSLLDALLARARLSVVDGAVSAAVLPLLLRVLSDTTLPITMTASDRQRLCERFVFSLTNSIGDLTRAEAVASACCLQLVLANVVIPFKKSFLDTQPSHRVFHGCFSDSEADAFKMVRHTFGDVVTALHKRTDETDAPATLLDDWKTNVMLEHVGPKLCLVRSLLEKVRVSVRRRVLRGRGHCIEVMRHRLQQLEHDANTAGQASGEVAEDVLHLFTLHPLPATARAAAAVSTTTAAAAAVTGAQTTAIGAGSAESGRRGAAAAPAAEKSEEGATAAMSSRLRERSRRGGGGRRGREERRRGEAASPASSSASPSSPTAATASAADASASSRQDRGGRDGKRGRDEREERGGGGGGRERRREESPPPKRRRGGRQFRR